MLIRSLHYKARLRDTETKRKSLNQQFWPYVLFNGDSNHSAIGETLGGEGGGMHDGGAYGVDSHSVNVIVPLTFQVERYFVIDKFGCDFVL